MEMVAQVVGEAVEEIVGKVVVVVVVGEVVVLVLVLGEGSKVAIGHQRTRTEK